MSLGHQLAISASRRAAARTYLELKRGIDSLATITSTGALLGLGLTLFGIMNSFVGGSFSSPDAMRARIMDNLGESLLPTAFGIALSLFALMLRHILETQLSTFEVEMENRPAELFALLPR